MPSSKDELLKYNTLGRNVETISAVTEIIKVTFANPLASSTRPLTEKILFNPVRGFSLLALKDTAFVEKFIVPPTTICVKNTVIKIGIPKRATPPNIRLKANSELIILNALKLSGWSHLNKEVHVARALLEAIPRQKRTNKPIMVDPRTCTSFD